MEDRLLRDLVEEARSFLEERWADRFEERGEAMPSPLSFGMCRFSALFLAEMLPERIGGSWTIAGGDPSDLFGRPLPSGGIRSPDGCWHGHYWVLDEARGLLVDVTADQFGLDPVRVLPFEDGAYEANFSDAEIAEHMVHVRDRVDRWLLEWSRRTAFEP